MTIDTEEAWDWSCDFPIRDPDVGNVRQLPRFQNLCSRYGIATTYFADHAVLANPESRDFVLDIASGEQVEIGLHIHPWNTPPLSGNGKVRARDSFLHNLPDTEVIAKLTTVLAEFERCDLQPTSFRGGRYSTCDVAQQLLRDHGMVADSSIVPYTTWEDDGAPDYRHRNLDPVRLPPRHDSDLAMWELPVAMGFTRGPAGLWRRFYQTVESTWLGRLHLIGIVERLGIVQRRWLSFDNQTADEILGLLNVLRKTSIPCACFTIHSSTLDTGPGARWMTAEDQERVYRDLETVFRVVSDLPDLEPACVTSVAKRLEQQYASCRN